MIRTTRRTRLTAPVALTMLLCIVSLSSSITLHNDADDTICNPVVVLHDHAAHRLVAGTVTGQSDTQHCFICHWQSLRSVAQVVRFLAPPQECRAFAGGNTTRFAAASFQPLSARAPPQA